MTTAAATPEPVAENRPRWLRWVIIALVIVVIGAIANLIGWDLRGWFKQLWDTITSISFADLVAACALKTVQTGAAAFAYYSILRYAYPGRVRWIQIFAAYAISVGLNSILPANLGTAVMLIMLTLIIPGATFAGILAVYGVQKIFFVVIGAFPYVYLFLTVGGSFDLQFEFIKDHPWAVAALLIGGAVLITLLIRMFWPRVVKWWDEAKEGGQILSHPRAYFLRVFTPSAVSWVAGLCVTAVFLSAYDIPVTFHTLMRIVAGNSIANVTSVTPGGAGVTQAFNVASLKGVTSTANATAYSIAQQLVTTAWNLLLAIVLMVWAFGWSGGRQLVEQSYGQAKEEEAKRKAARQAKKEAKRAADEAENA
ncbi:MAG TPA: lysylphosphatidylglycerol synthase transmembrane domain-containing protein [Gaiellaceae bacterium]|nr:lysylphosphatidylglycerol synthase transmembrane domain-containing protein [Gaiellaceae bacterium]